MHVVATADIHNTKPKLPDGDLLLIAGDLTERGTPEQLRQFAQWLKGRPHKHKVVIAGNHDFCLERKTQRQEAEIVLGGVCTYLLDQEISIEGKRIYGSPWQPWFHDWAFNVPRSTIAEKWASIPSGLDVFLVHGPPHGYGDLTLGNDRVGCEAMLGALKIKRPRYTLFGHIHEAAGSWEMEGLKIVNCSSGYGTQPAYEFDL
jgi:Icc-related predicted phosphoesterase